MFVVRTGHAVTKHETIIHYPYDAHQSTKLYIHLVKHIIKYISL